MGLKGKVNKLDEVQEAFRSLYKEVKKDGQEPFYALDVEDMEHKDDITGLKNALEDERRQNTERGQRLTALEAEKTKLAGDLETARKSKGSDESAIESAKKELIEKHTGELTAANKKSDGYRAALDKVVRMDAARAAIARAKGSPDLLLPHVLDRTQFVENQDGTFAVVVVNEKGTPRIGDSQGNPMTLDQLVAEMKSNEVYGRAFEASPAGGSGAQNNGGGASGKRSVSARDQDALNANIEAIAKGEVVVTD